MIVLLVGHVTTKATKGKLALIKGLNYFYKNG